MELNPEGNYQLRAPNNKPITHAITSMLARAELPEHNLEAEGDTFVLTNGDYTDHLDHTSTPERWYGEAIYEDEDGEWHMAGDLLIVQVNEDGTEERVNRNYTEGITPVVPLFETAAATPEERAALVFEYANWFLQSRNDDRLTSEARERVQRRAIGYAQLGGLSAQLRATLHALGQEPIV